MKEERNGDSSEWNQDTDMRLRLWRDAMNILIGEALCWFKKAGNVLTGGIWRGIRILRCWHSGITGAENAPQVRYKQSITTPPASTEGDVFLLRGSISHKQYLHAQTEPSFHRRIAQGQHASDFK